MSAKVLIIDDSPTALGMLKVILEGEGYDILLAESGEEGVRKAKEENPDLVISDTLLPGIDGFEVCRQIKKAQNPTAPKVIVMTGSIDAVDAVKARKVGADDYCVKTSDFSSLLGAVKNLSKA